MSFAEDERHPLLRNIDANLKPGGHPSDAVDIATILDLIGDTENPSNWSGSYKWRIVSLLACTGNQYSDKMQAFADGLDSSHSLLHLSLRCAIRSSIIEDLDKQESKTASVLLVTTWELGEATGPFLIAPLSEMLGRGPVVNACNIVLVACTILASLADSGVLITATRYLSGMLVTVNVLSPAILGDMLDKDQLGTAMSLIVFSSLLGGAVGPVVGGILATRWGWRTVLRICAAGVALVEVCFLTIFQETYEPILIKQKLCKADGHQTPKTILPPYSGTQRRPLVECLVRPFAYSGLHPSCKR